MYGNKNGPIRGVKSLLNSFEECVSKSSFIENTKNVKHIKHEYDESLYS